MSHSGPQREGVTFVIPCLNEEVTLPHVLAKLDTLRRTLNRPVEIIVSDNGSTDRSATIAREWGASVVACTPRGYGAALLNGINASTYDIIVFADADNTYDFLEAPQLIEKIDAGEVLVIGSRLDGIMQPGAMATLHRYLGTPVLNIIINLLYANKGARVRDCNSGFRAFRRTAFQRWQVDSPGMEFASVMLIKALLAGTPLTHVPISLHANPKGRVPHLKTWRDGMRHLLQVFLHSPHFFCRAGLAIFAGSWLVTLVGFFYGPIRLSAASVLDVHTMIFSMLFALFGQVLWGTGLYIAVNRPSRIRQYNWLILLGEAELFWISAVFAAACTAIFFNIFHTWAQNNYAQLALQKESIVLASLASTGILFISQALTAHLLKRA